MKNNPVSPGIVMDTETICRGAYGPPPSTHYSKGGRLRIGQLVRKRDVVSGEISVWRFGDEGHISRHDLIEILNGVAQENQETYQLLGIGVRETRERRIDQHNGRIFCIIDDCVCDMNGNTHPAHASITLCKGIKDMDLNPDDPLFDAIKETLTLMFSRGVLWRHKDAPVD